MLLNGCTVTLPNAKICATSGVLSAGADCAYMNDDRTEELTLDQWIAFLEPQISPERGAAVCMSSEDFSKLKSAIEQACSQKGISCTREAKEQIVKVSQRYDGLQKRVRRKKLQVPHVP